MLLQKTRLIYIMSSYSSCDANHLYPQFKLVQFCIVPRNIKRKNKYTYLLKLGWSKIRIYTYKIYAIKSAPFANYNWCNIAATSTNVLRTISASPAMSLKKNCKSSAIFYRRIIFRELEAGHTYSAMIYAFSLLVTQTK